MKKSFQIFKRDLGRLFRNRAAVLILVGIRINKNEQDFVLKYFQPGKLDTRKALQKVKARVGFADAKLLCSLTHSGIVFNYVVGDFHRPCLNI